jgi:hypothetical protein
MLRVYVHACPSSLTLARRCARSLPLVLGLGLISTELQAQDDQTTTIVTNGGTVTTSPGSSVVVKVNGTVISASSSTSDSVSETTVTPGLSVEPTSKTEATPSRWDLEAFAGVRFGGIIGASFDNTLTYDCHGAVMPELSTDIGVGGVTFGLGARWLLSKKEWTLSNSGLSLNYDSNTAIILRAISPYRWEDRHRHPSLWRGIVSDGGWYYGGEVDVVVDNLALAAQATWEMRSRGHGPRYTLAYGFGF